MSGNDNNYQAKVDLVKDQIVIDVLKERKGERVWRWIRRAGIATAFTLTLIVTAVNLFKSSGGIIPSGEKVAVVKIHGEIGDGSLASAAKVVPALRKAFETEGVKAVVLDIDSPGGQPQEAERIYREIDRLKQKHKKPVVSVISAQGASAAYLIAIHTDKIVAGHYSMVGSIGALVQTWDLSRVSAKVGVGRNTVTSGKYKDLMNPFREMSADERAKVNQLVHAMADRFIAEVVERRKHDPDFAKRTQDIFTGEVWSGGEAVALGLVDSIGTLEEVTLSYGGKVAEFGPGAGGGGLFSMFSPDLLVDRVATRITEKLTAPGIDLR